MSLTSEELNYLIWRYLQERGLEVSSLALLDETSVYDFDTKYGKQVPMGSLVNLVQKGILYSLTDQLIEPNGRDKGVVSFNSDKINLFNALGVDIALNGVEPNRERVGENGNGSGSGSSGGDANRGGNSVSDGKDVNMDKDGDRENSPGFIKILQKKLGFGEPALSLSTNPKSSSVLAYGLTEARAKIKVLYQGEEKTVLLNHPLKTFTDRNINSGDVCSLAWSPNGDLLITAVESGELRLWSADGKLRNVMVQHQSPVVLIEWSPDGSSILTTDTTNVSIIWDSLSGHVKQTIDTLKPDTTLTTPTGQDQIVAMGVDSTWIDDSKFIIPGFNGSALVFELGQHSPIGTLIGHSKAISVMKFNSNNKLLLTASDDRSMRIWDGGNFNSTHVLLGHSQPITFADWLNDKLILSCSLDATVRVWEALTGQQITMEFTDGVPILFASLSPNGGEKLAIGTTESVVTIYDIVMGDRSVKINAVAQYQPDVPEGEDENYMTSLDWSITGDVVIAGYSKAESVIIGV